MIAICIASGPSLIQEDVDYCRGKGKVYVVNDCYRLAPWADVLYACDEEWWNYHQPEFAGEKYTVSHKAAEKYGLNYRKISSKLEWSRNPDIIGRGGHGGFHVMNLAALQGAEKIILLGYDIGEGSDRKKHWFGNHPAGMNRDQNYRRWIENFKKVRHQIPIPVINCSRETKLDCFPHMALREAI